MTLINREDAIDELRHLIPYKKYQRGEWVYLLEKKEVFKAINALPSTDMVSRKDFEPVDNKLYLNPVCRNCKHSSYCNNIPTDENNEDIEHYDAYGRPVLSVKECKDYEPESKAFFVSVG